MATAYLGLGSNLGKREENLSHALELLSRKAAVDKVSSVYETDPVGYADQPRFLNAVCRVTTALSPLSLLRLAKDTEAKLGRKPSFRNAPREIDVDILLYDGRVVTTQDLVVPHPRMAERAFVLVPLAEIAPGVVHPVVCRTMAELARDVPGKEGVQRTGIRLVLPGARSSEGRPAARQSG